MRPPSRRLASVLPLALLFLASGLATSPLLAEDLVSWGPARMTPGLARDLEQLPSATPYQAFVHFASLPPADRTELVEGHGLTVLYEYRAVDVVFASGSVGDFRALSREPAVIYMEENRKLDLLLDTSPWAVRVRAAHEEVSGGPFLDPDGNPLDGRGVSIILVDSGVDATHPDLQPRVGKNIKVVCTTPGLVDDATGACFGPVEFVDVGNAATTDSSSGHGTGVAGVAVGEGNASTGHYPGAAPHIKGSFAGVAPGAKLHVYSVGEFAAVFNFTVAWDHIVSNLDGFDPPARIVNNSFGEAGGATYDPNSLFAKLVKKLSEKNLTVTFAAGNGDALGNGGDGSADITTSFCDDPTPGVICAGSYNDNDVGTRNGGVSGFSSKGKIGSPETYPDLLAPGDFITVPCKPEQPICSTAALPSPEWPGFYSIALGTSYSAPHVAGMAALLYQADPGLTPAGVEDLLLDTALKFGGGYEADPQNPGGTTSFDRGAGLVDVASALAALGVPRAGDPVAGQPRVRINDPADGSVSDGTGAIPVSGTAADGTVPPSVPAAHVIFDADAGDAITAPAAADIESLTVQEAPSGSLVAGLAYTVEIVDATDLPSGGVVSFRLFQNVDGRPFSTRIDLSAVGASIAPADEGNTAPATTASLAGNTIQFFVPMSNLGHPPAGAPAHNVFMVSFEEVFSFPLTSVGGFDMAPGNNPPSPASFPLLLDQVFPQFGRPYTVLRPDLVTAPPAAEVRLSVDGGAEQPTTLSGGSPDYAWSTSVDPTPLADGTHELKATLYLGGVASASHKVTIEIDRSPQQFTYDVLITNPPDGSTVPRSTVEIRGLATTDDPSTDRAVTVQVQGSSFDSGELAASLDGEAWTATFDFGSVQAGTYTITGRFYVGGVERDDDAISVRVREPGTEVSCLPRTIGFWRRQFSDNEGSQKFTDGEADTLAFHAAGLSDGYFAGKDDLLAALFAGGDEGPERRAARQFAGLLLNLAAGDLSAGMSYPVGLSGNERLDPAVYDTAVVGQTVNEAKTWIRSQLPDGNLGGANEVADAINNGHGLICD